MSSKHVVICSLISSLWITSFAQHQSTPALACAFVSSTRSQRKRAHYDHGSALLPPQQATNSANDGNDGADDLTKEILNERFWETRDYYRQNPQENMSQADVCLKLLSTRLPNVRLNRCFVAPSTVKDAGNGLFASRDIANDELITMYPGDAVLIAKQQQEPTEDTDEKAPPVVGVIFGNHIQVENRDPNLVSTPEAKRYEMRINQQTSIVADPNLGFDDAAYLGHYANDGAALLKFDAASRQAYSKASMERQNSAHFVMEGAHMVTVATKPIRKGEEIFVSYEEGYWLSRSLLSSDSSSMSNDDSSMDAAEKIALMGDLAAAATKTSPVLRVRENNSGTRKPTNVAKGRKKKKNTSSQSSKKKGFGK